MSAALVLLPSCTTSATRSDAGTEPDTRAEPNAGAAVGFYSLEQAVRGREAFRRVCGECHKTSDFRGRDFEWEWRRQTVWKFYIRLTMTMPEDDPGTLRPQTYADVIAYILQINDYASGTVELVPTAESMDVIPLGPGVDKRAIPGGDIR